MSASAVRAASAALLWCLTAVAHAETAASEAVVAGLNLQRMPNANGGDIGVDWVQATERRVITAGADIADIGQSQWTVFRATAAQKRGPRPAVSGSVDLGPGTNAGERFTFLKLGVGLSASLSEQWRVFARDTYVDVEPVSGHIVAVGGETTRPNGVSLQLQTARSISGSLDEDSHLVRFDYRARPPYLMAGIALTTTNDRLALGAEPMQTSTTRVRQGFFGVSFPVRGKELTIAADIGEVGDVRRTGLSLILRSPIDSRERSDAWAR
jgi:hypothetical protein